MDALPPPPPPIPAQCPAEANVRFRLVNVRLVPGVFVSGTVRWAYEGGASSARVEVRSPGATTSKLRIEWLKEPHATATVEGVVDGRRLRATMPAP